jgi:hypothetical protein
MKFPTEQDVIASDVGLSGMPRPGGGPDEEEVQEEGWNKAE